MINKKKAKMYCGEDVSLIENYDKAVADQTQTWDIHHQGETLPCGRYSRKTLIEFGLYWKRPASELIFLTKRDHQRLHKKGIPKGHLSEKTRRKMSEAHKGKRHSEEERHKISAARLGTHHSEETRRKISEARRRRLSGAASAQGSPGCSRKTPGPLATSPSPSSGRSP